VIAECKAHGIPPPSFEERQGWMVVTFRAPIAPTGAGEAPRGAGEETREKSTEKVLRLLRESPTITIQETAKSLGLSDAGVEKVIKKLKRDGRLRRIGPDKGGRWEVIS
jgi:ATP-dependent DNA helicase RecG